MNENQIDQKLSGLGTVWPAPVTRGDYWGQKELHITLLSFLYSLTYCQQERLLFRTFSELWVGGGPEL